MVVAKTGRKNTNRNIGHPDLDEPKRSRYRYAKSIEDNQKMIEEMQQHLLQIDKNITERKVYACLLKNHSLSYIYIYLL